MEVDSHNFPEPDRSRQPMNIAVVLDRSGSMDEERKMDNAKQAITMLVDQLSSDDYLSLIIYDDRVETIYPSQHVRDRSVLRRLIEDIYPRGATNLGGGLQEGYRQLDRNYRQEYVNRVILLSDGLANRGITDPAQLCRMAEDHRNEGVSLSTIGVGLDYNENLMLGLANHGGGNYSFVESPAQLASVLRHEFQGLCAIVARNARIVVDPGDGVVIDDVIGCERRNDGGSAIFPIGDLTSRDHREYTVALRVAPGSGTRQIATGKLLFDRVPGMPRCNATGFTVTLRYSDDAAELGRGKDWATQGKVDIALSSKKVEQAMQMIDQGNSAEARRRLDEAVTTLESSPAATNSEASAGIIGSRISVLRGYAHQLRSDSTDTRKLKKSMQYDTYKSGREKP
jgi:Ca-activated chloride channel family protein